MAEAEKSLNEQIERVLKNGVTEAELEKAKNRFLTGKLMERETNNGKANALGEAVVMYHDPGHINTDLVKYQAVTAKQVKDVLNKYLNGEKRVLIEYLPEANKEAAGTCLRGDAVAEAHEQIDPQRANRRGNPMASQPPPDQSRLADLCPDQRLVVAETGRRGGGEGRHQAYRIRGSTTA